MLHAILLAGKAAKGTYTAWSLLSPEDKQRLLDKVRVGVTSAATPAASAPNLTGSTPNPNNKR